MMNIITRFLLAMCFCLLGISAHAESNTNQYTVKAGDKLEKLALSHSTNVNVIMEMNKGKIKNKNLIFVGQVITLPQATAQTSAPAVVMKNDVKQPHKAAHSVRHTAKVQAPTAPVATSVAPSVWNPTEQAACNDCALENFLEGNYPKEVAATLETEVNNGTYQNVLIASGDHLEAMLFDNNVTRQNVVALWSDDHKEPARLYTAIDNGMEYALVYPEHGGNWSKMTTAPDAGELLAIKNSVQEITGPTDMALPIAVIIWKGRHGSAVLPVLQNSVGAQYAASLPRANQAPNARTINDN